MYLAYVGAFSDTTIYVECDLNHYKLSEKDFLTLCNFSSELKDFLKTKKWSIESVGISKIPGYTRYEELLNQKEAFLRTLEERD